MKIAVNAADLCSARIDGTRIYIKNVLNHLGGLGGTADSFFIYLKGALNPNLSFTMHPNYMLRRSRSPFFWTQLRLPFALAKDRPDVLWMPLQTVPFMLKDSIETVVTIHDLAFKMFPDHFPRKDLLLLSLFTKHAVKRASRVIAVSENTKKDVVRFYGIDPQKITVVYHGYDENIFNIDNAQDVVKIEEARSKYKIKGRYVLYAGAIQPRKNLDTLIASFELLKKDPKYNEFTLVIAGSNAWMYEQIHQRAAASPCKEDIIFTGPYVTEDLPQLLGGAEVFVFPSLYEGFGIPLLEAMACGVPVVSADNSSLPEVGGEAIIYCDAASKENLAERIKLALGDIKLREEMVKKGLEQVKKFSWEICAQKTFAVLTGKSVV